MTQERVGPGSWTDAYLAAFAEAHSYALVTFDTGFERWPAFNAGVRGNVTGLSRE